MPKHFKRNGREFGNIIWTMNETEPIEYFYDDGLLTQIRFNLSDKDPSIKNKKLILSTRHFKEFTTSFHERHLDREGLKIVDYYANNKLTSYTELPEIKIKIIYI